MVIQKRNPCAKLLHCFVICLLSDIHIPFAVSVFSNSLISPCYGCTFSIFGVMLAYKTTTKKTQSSNFKVSFGHKPRQKKDFKKMARAGGDRHLSALFRIRVPPAPCPVCGMALK